MKKLITLISTSFLIFNLAPVIKISEINTKVNSANLKATNNPLAPKIINNKLIAITSQAVSKDGILYVGTPDGLNRSIDGISFTKINEIQGCIQNIFINDNTGVVWVITYNLHTGSNSKIYQSQDGINFNESSNFFNDKTALVIIEFNGIVYVGTSGGLYASSNGTNFTKIDQVQGTINDFTITYFPGAQTDKTLFAGGSSGIYELNDNDFVFYGNIKSETKVLTADENGNIFFVKNNNELYKEVFPKANFIKQFPEYIDSILIINKTIYLGTINSGALYTSTDGKTFNKILDVNTSYINCLTVDSKGVILMGDAMNGLRAMNLPYKLVNLHGADFDSNNNCFVFKNDKVIDLNPEFLDAAMLDGVSIPINSQGINLTKKQQTLVLILKNQYRNYADLFGGTKGNQVITYTLTV